MKGGFSRTNWKNGLVMERQISGDQSSRESLYLDFWYWHQDVFLVLVVRLHKPITRFEILNLLYFRHQLTGKQFVYITDVSKENISLNKCARNSSVSDGQGFGRRVSSNEELWNVPVI